MVNNHSNKKEKAAVLDSSDMSSESDLDITDNDIESYDGEESSSGEESDLEIDKKLYEQIMVNKKQKPINIIVQNKIQTRKRTRENNLDNTIKIPNITKKQHVSIYSNDTDGMITRIKKRTLLKSRKKLVNKYRQLNKSKNDIDDSDSDIDDSDSDIDDSDSDDMKDFIVDDLNDPAYKKKDGVYENFISSVVKSMNVDTEKQIKEEARSSKWQKGLTKREIKDLKPHYQNICDKIDTMPQILTLLKTNIPFKDKCDLMEQIIILDNLQSETFDHLNLKNVLNDELIKYDKMQLTDEKYKEYDDLEYVLKKQHIDETPLKYRIFNSDMSLKNKTKLFARYTHMMQLSERSSERGKLTNWIEHVLDLPTKYIPTVVCRSDGNEKINAYLSKVRAILDSEVYGLDVVKDQIMFVLNNKITHPDVKGCCLGLVGPPGVAKTSIANILAKAVGMPLQQIAMGTINDNDSLVGHDFTYEGSCPGVIYDSVKALGQTNGIIFMDELDKISQTQHGQAVSKCMLHITDSTQHHLFHDQYLGNEIDIDLSRIWFIFSMNHRENVDKTLADRIPMIEIPGYTNNEKKQIALLHLIPRTLKNLDINKNDIIFDDDALIHIITKSNNMYEHEVKDRTGNTGVRQLKYAIINIITKINMLRNTILEDGTYGALKFSFAIKNFKMPFTITKDIVDKMAIFPEKQDIHLSMYM
jgi:ATP-dependent Lon protease